MANMYSIRVINGAPFPVPDGAAEQCPYCSVQVFSQAQKRCGLFPRLLVNSAAAYGRCSLLPGSPQVALVEVARTHMVRDDGVAEGYLTSYT